MRAPPSPAHQADGADGFTLIELMVVILIIAILLAIAIPTFLGARQRAQDRSVQSDLRNGLTAAQQAYANPGDYSTAGYVNMSIELSPNLYFVDAGTVSSGPKYLSIDTPIAGGAATPQQWTAAELSATGTCFAITAVMTGTGTASQGPGVYYQQTPNGASTCNATNGDGATAHSWS